MDDAKQLGKYGARFRRLVLAPPVSGGFFLAAGYVFFAASVVVLATELVLWVFQQREPFLLVAVSVASLTASFMLTIGGMMRGAQQLFERDPVLRDWASWQRTSR